MTVRALVIPYDDRKPIRTVDLADGGEVYTLLGGTRVQTVRYHGRADAVPLLNPDSTGPLNMRATFLIGADPIMGTCVLVGAAGDAGAVTSCPPDLVKRLGVRS